MQPIDPGSSVKVFISYAHADQELHRKLLTHLSPLIHSREITIWHDQEIPAGANWDDQIKSHLNEADVILLLVSPDFFNSDYCWKEEVEIALERHNAGTAWVVPIILRPAQWRDTPLGPLQVLPTGAVPVTQWKDQDVALDNIVQGIRRIVRSEEKKKHKSVPDRTLWLMRVVITTILVLLLISCIFVDTVIIRLLAVSTIILVSFVIWWTIKNRKLEERWDRKEKTDFTVAVMGFQGVGKTTFLASMFRYLSITKEVGFTLNTEEDEEEDLVTIYNNLTREGKFPEKTAGGETVAWTFDGLSSEGPSYTFFRFTFLDYPGEWAENMFDKNCTDINSKIKKVLLAADIVWYIIDGQEILKFMDGKPSDTFPERLHDLLKMMEKRGRKPVYCILTKWDLLSARNYNLDCILASLERVYPDFQLFFENRSGRHRFIPVSVGSFQVNPDPNSDAMVWMGSEAVQPSGVEIPLIYSILEFFEDEIVKAYSTRLHKLWGQGRGNIPKIKQGNKKQARKSMYYKIYHYIYSKQKNQI